MARKKYEEAGDNHERWLISYADFITLLFAFFVVMYAISIVNEGKYKVLSNALGDAFGGRGAVTKTTSSVEPPLPLSSIIARKRFEAANPLAPLIKTGKVRVTQTSRGVSVEINASVLFDPGEARLAGDSKEVLGAVAGLLKSDTHAIQVEGHTDITPISNSAFASNWELSTVRASSVVRLFIDKGVAEKRLTAVGNAANQPVASNDDAVGRARNRRVAVTILAALPEGGSELPAR
jgi:chemotaxis protein MotB